MSCSCAHCTVTACEYAQRDAGKLPENCPMLQSEKMESIRLEYLEPSVHKFYAACSQTEAEGYGEWPRLRETAEFCKKMGYGKIGLAFCGGLRQEALVAANVLRKHGLKVVSVVCKAGGIDKEQVGIEDKYKIHPGCYEPACNPIAQAKLLNEEKTEFNVVLGLCVGHDSLFLRHSEAPATVLVAKDRALGNNPAAAIYTANTYCKSKLV